MFTYRNKITKIQCPKTKTFFPVERHCDGYIDCTGSIDEESNSCKTFYEKLNYSCGSALDSHNGRFVCNISFLPA